MDSFEFKDCLFSFFSKDKEATKVLGELDWDKWFYAAGFPPKPIFDLSLVDVCYNLADKWGTLSAISSKFEPKKEDISGWTANQIVVFLEKVQDFEPPLRKEDVQMMGNLYNLDKSQNVEVVSRYLRIGLNARYEATYQRTAELLGKVGRMKFVRP